MKFPLFLLFLFFAHPSFSQDYSGKWFYEVIDTPTGDYFGEMILTKNQSQYSIKLKSNSGEFPCEILYFQNDSLAFTTNAEDFFSRIDGRFVGDDFYGRVQVLGYEDLYTYVAERRTNSPEQVFQLLDKKTNVPISFAHVKAGDEIIITNEKGLFQIRKSQRQQVEFSAIGYHSKTTNIDWLLPKEERVIYLKTNETQLPDVLIEAKTLVAKDIIKAAVNRLKLNYIQTAYNSGLFFRFTNYDVMTDTVIYQSEAILDFYDSKGYQKRGWRKAAKTRAAKLVQGRVLKGNQQNKLLMTELRTIPFFWTHESIVTKDKPLSKRSISAYDFKLVAEKKFNGADVYEISFEANKLKYRYTGLARLKYFKGKIYINKADYAVLRFESESWMEYKVNNKRTKREWGGSEKNVVKTIRIEVFTKPKNHYILSYGKEKTYKEHHKIKENEPPEINKFLNTKELQFFDFKTEAIVPIKSNLFKFDKTYHYDPSFWSTFNPVLK